MELGHHSMLIDIHKTYSAKLNQIASLVNASLVPVTSSCDCQSESVEFALCENNLSCMDRVMYACEGFLDRMRKLEHDCDNMTQILNDKGRAKTNLPKLG